MQSLGQYSQDRLKSDTFHEQIGMLFSQTPLVSLSNIPAAMITAYIFKDTVPLSLLLIWACLVCFYSIVRIYPTQVFRRLSQPDLATWKKISIVSVFIIGSLWGSMVLFFNYELSQFQEYYIVLLLLGLSSISIAANRAYLPTFFAFIFPALLPISWYFLKSGRLELMGLGILVLLYIVILIGSAKSAVVNTKKTIQLRLQNRYLLEELSHSNLELNVEIEERKYIQEELEKSRQEAIEANHAKSEFLSRMSHELRTPLNAILGYSDLLLEDSVLVEQQSQDLKRIKRAGEHLLGLINEVLDISRIESGGIDLLMETVELADVVYECEQLVKEQAKRSVINLHVQSKQDVNYFVHADRKRLKQVLLNFISNAIKYNKQGGEVWVEWVLKENNKVHVSVRDNGIGITKEKQQYLFQPFNRLGADNTNIEGTGIGLVIAKRLVEIMNGETGFSSSKEDGSVFWFELDKYSKPR